MIPIHIPYLYLNQSIQSMSFPGDAVEKNLPAIAGDARDMDSFPG